MKRFLVVTLVFSILVSSFSSLIVYSQDDSITTLEDLGYVDWGRYTGNMGDSSVFNLDKSININGYSRNGNVGVDGTVYNNGFEVWIARWNFGDNISWAYRTVKLDNKYSTLCGSTGLIKSYNTTNFDTTAYFYSGSTLLYSVRMTPSNWKHDFVIDVSGVDELKVLVQDNVKTAGGTSFALYDLFLSNDDCTVTRKTSTLISNHYQAAQYANASYGDLCQSTTSFIMTVENYERILLDALNNSLNKNTNNDIEASKKQIRLNGAAQLQAKDNGTNDKMLSIYATFPKEDYHYCYEALYDIIADGGEDAIELQKIDTDDEEIVVATNIVKEVLNGINNISFTKQYGKYDISVSALNLSFKFLGVENVFSGTMTVKNRTNKKTYTVAINSKMSDVADAMGAYIKQLIQLEQNIYKSELKKAIECIDKNSKISDFGKNSVKKKLNSFAESGVFSRIGLGKANETLGKCAQIYDLIKSVNQDDQKVSDMIKKAEKIRDTLDSIIFDDTTITDKAVKDAYKKLSEARTNLQSYAISYLSGETTEDDEESVWWKPWTWSFKCPVDITVTDIDGNVVGYVKGEEIYYEDEIFITKEGDVKKVYLPNTTDYNIVTTGNDYGLLNCTLESYENGEPVGRSNFYDIELYDGKEITINDDISDITTEHTNITLSSNEETVLETEYFNESDNAAITVSISCENGGIAEGSGTYVKGDSITVLAIPNDGYVFKGWYKNDEWLSNDISYSFSANTDIDLVAKFDEYQEFIPTYDLNISDRYNDKLIGDIQVENNIVTMSLYQKDETINIDDFTCYLAYYADSRLTSVKILSPIITEEGYIQFTSNIEDSNFKIMLWNDSMMPVMSAILSVDILSANEETAEN